MVCNKCRQCPPYGSDTWCLGCSGLQALGTELAASWRTPALRNIANDLVVSAVRGVTALREVAGCIESAGSARAALPRRDPNRLPPPPEPPQPPRTPRAADPPGDRERSRERRREVKDQEESSEEESVEEEEEEGERRSPRAVAATPKSGPPARPPEPEHPPPRRSEDQARDGHHHRHHHSHDRDGHQHRDNRGGHRRGNRAGSKRQRLHRQLEDPEIRVHRRPPRPFWQEDRPFAGHRGPGGR